MNASNAGISAAKSHLLGYLKHTPGFEHRVHHFAGLSIEEILSRVREQDEKTHRTCIERFRQHGIVLETQASIEAAALGDLVTVGNVADLMADLNDHH